MNANTQQRIYTMRFATVYPLYVAKAERKGRTKDEVDTIIRWLTGYTQEEVDRTVAADVTLEAFFGEAPHPNPARKLITGVICGVKVQEIEDPIMREVRRLDKLVDELARGKAMDSILRRP